MARDGQYNSRSPDRIVVLFLDGVGLGNDDHETNPLSVAAMPTLTGLLDGNRPLQSIQGYSSSRATLRGLDARLDVPGLPQSGTGQVSLLTGKNAAALLGQHEGPYPNRQLQALLAQGSLFSATLAAGRTAAFANAYSDRFLDRVTRGTQRLSANARAALLAGLPLRGPGELIAGEAVSSLLSNDYFRQIGYDVPDISLDTAGRRLARLSSAHALTFFEFWYTDVVGHQQKLETSLQVLNQLDQFLAGLLADLDLASTLLMMVSDHGNLEDLSTNKHTCNPALCVTVGASHEALADSLQDLTDVETALLSILLG